MNSILRTIQNSFGTTDLEWFIAAEAYIDTIFELKLKNASQIARDII